MPNHDPTFERLQAALEAQSVGHWWPVLFQWLSNGEGWHNLYTGLIGPDPAILEVIELVESGQVDSDAAFALTLANLEFARRRAGLGRGLRWDPFDGPLRDFLDLDPAARIKTYHDVRRPALRIAHELLGWALFELDQAGR